MYQYALAKSKSSGQIELVYSQKLGGFLGERLSKEVMLENSLLSPDETITDEHVWHVVAVIDEEDTIHMLEALRHLDQAQEELVSKADGFLAMVKDLVADASTLTSSP